MVTWGGGGTILICLTFQKCLASYENNKLCLIYTLNCLIQSYIRHNLDIRYTEKLHFIRNTTLWTMTFLEMRLSN